MMQYKIILILISFLFPFFGTAQQKTVAVKGHIDLRGHELQHTHTIALDGEWRFFWKQLLTPQQLLKDSSTKAYIQVPQLFHNTTLNNQELESFGYATYHLNILYRKGETLALSYNRLFSASKIWINGVLVQSAGRVAPDRTNETALLYPDFHSFASTDTISVVLQISNFHHKKGGIDGSITLSNNSWKAKEKAQKVGLDSFLFGIIFIISFYQLGIYIFRRGNAYSMYFALFGASMAMYVLANNEIVLTKIFPEMPWWLFQKVNYLGTLTRVFFWMAFLSVLFPNEIRKNIVKIIGYITIVLAVTIIILPAWIYTFILPVILVTSALSLIYLVRGVLLSVMRKREGGWYTFIGTLAMFITGTNDILFESAIIQSAYLLPFGVLVFFLMQSFMLAMHFAKSFNRAEKLSAEMTLINDNLEGIVTKRTTEIEQQKEEISAQRDQLEVQRDMAKEQYIELKKRTQELSDSITYAKNIQQAMLPPEDLLSSAFPEHFVLYQPRDVVSGDFYWFKEFIKDGRPIYVVAAADCTGHGVPGAFLSMLGISLLNEIVPNRNLTKPSQFLEEMRKELKASLRQKAGFRMRKDGIDIALCVIDPTQKTLQYAGAYNPLFLIRNNELSELKAVPSPVGVHHNELDFKNHTITLNGNEQIYIFSDGFSDQLGGKYGHKFLKKQFKQLLLQNSSLPMQEQKSKLTAAFEEWRCDTRQIDDVLVIGLQLASFTTSQ